MRLDELELPEDYRKLSFPEFAPWRFDTFRQYNDKAERIVGRRLLPENDPAKEDPGIFNPELYETFAMPVHRLVFGKFAPDKKLHRRYQHSDSAMGHLLPLLAELDLTGANFGPTLTVSEIRKHCPNAVIHGQLAPFTLSRSEHANIVGEFFRDLERAKEKRGLVFTTAGSINNGSSLQSIRLIMSVIQHHGRY